MLTHTGTRTIETPRLILRRARMEDAQAMYDNWASEPEVTRYLTWPTHESVEVTRMVLQSWVDSYKKDSYYQWLIVPKDNGNRPIGSLLADLTNEAVGTFHIGYCIGRRWWHQGIMSETLEAVIRYLFTQVNAHRIEARHDPNNPHSGGVMKKCGMLYEGTSRQSDRNNQGICDAAHYAILRRDWEKR